MTETAGSNPADRIELEPSGIYDMGKKKVTKKAKPGPKPETLKIEGDWKDAVRHAMKRGKPRQGNEPR